LSTEFSRGTPSYRAPELKAEVSTFSNKVDIWGLGCILYELAVKRKAFTDDWAVRAFVETKQKLVVRLEYFGNEIQTPLTNLIHEMLQVNPRLRPSALQLHAVFSDLLKASPGPRTHESGSPLLSKIFQPLSNDTDQSSVYVETPFTSNLPGWNYLPRLPPEGEQVHLMPPEIPPSSPFATNEIHFSQVEMSFSTN